ncbi:MAG: hypothetical protein ACR2PL_14715 [Dehalococcoidia bacterium]
MATNTTPGPSDLWAQALTTWTQGWQAAVGYRTNAGAPSSDPFQLWRRSMDQWLSGWTAFLEGILQTPEAITLSGRMLDSILNVEKPLRERTTSRMQYWLEFLNLPSNNGLLRIAVQLNDANARLDELQEQVETLTDKLEDLGDTSDVKRRLGVTIGGE